MLFLGDLAGTSGQSVHSLFSAEREGERKKERERKREREKQKKKYSKKIGMIIKKESKN